MRPLRILSARPNLNVWPVPRASFIVDPRCGRGGMSRFMREDGEIQVLRKEVQMQPLAPKVRMGRRGGRYSKGSRHVAQNSRPFFRGSSFAKSIRNSSGPHMMLIPRLVTHAVVGKSAIIKLITHAVVGKSNSATRRKIRARRREKTPKRPGEAARAMRNKLPDPVLPSCQPSSRVRPECTHAARMLARPMAHLLRPGYPVEGSQDPG